MVRYVYILPNQILFVRVVALSNELILHGLLTHFTFDLLEFGNVLALPLIEVDTTITCCLSLFCDECIADNFLGSVDVS